MSYTVQFDTGDIAAKAQAIRSTADEIETLLNTLNSQMIDLSHSYTGAAANAFQEVYQQWQTTQAQVKEELNEISTGLVNTGQARDDQEQSLTSQWNAARG
jgi:WXG100 family type VII secretion target